MDGGERDDEPRRKIPFTAEEVEASQPEPPEDDPAQKEAAQLTRGKSVRDLKREKEEKDHTRSEMFKDHFELIALFVLWSLFLGFLALAAVWLFHLIAPTTGTKPLTGLITVRGWLNPAQLDKIEGILAGGIIAGLVADHFKRRMG